MEENLLNLYPHDTFRILIVGENPNISRHSSSKYSILKRDKISIFEPTP